jgi:hypothetical protein
VPLLKCQLKYDKILYRAQQALVLSVAGFGLVLVASHLDLLETRIHGFRWHETYWHRHVRSRVSSLHVL